MLAVVDPGPGAHRPGDRQVRVELDRTGVQQLRELLRRSRLHITDLEHKRRDLDAHINEFKEVETQVTAELKQRGVDPEGDD